MGPQNMIQFNKEIVNNLDAATSREWLETNGLGGFSSSTIIGLNTRRYHGLLTAATKPPVGRIEVDPYLCIGCQKCISKGPDGAFLDGCPWDAIEMVPTDDWEAVHGITLPDLPPAPPTA